MLILKVMKVNILDKLKETQFMLFLVIVFESVEVTECSSIVLAFRCKREELFLSGWGIIHL